MTGKKLTPAAYRRVAKGMKKLQQNRLQADQIIKQGDAALVEFARCLLQSRDQKRVEAKLIRSKKRPIQNRRAWNKLKEQEMETNKRMGQAVETWATAIVQFHELRSRS